MARPLAKPENESNPYTTIRVSKTFLDQLRVAAGLMGVHHADFCDIVLASFLRTQIRRMLAGGAVQQDFTTVCRKSDAIRKARRDAP